MNYTIAETKSSLLTCVGDESAKKSVVLEEGQLYNYMLAYITNHLAPSSAESFEYDEHYGVKVLSSKAHDKDSSTTKGRISLEIGVGKFAFYGYNGEIYYALHQYIGKPVGTNCGATVLKKLIIFANSSADSLAAFLNQVLETAEANDETKFTCFSWHIRHEYWKTDSHITKRNIDSVVLPNSIKDRLIKDMTKFLAPRTMEFYSRNGIPYRRSYLFYGVPGTGKTSLVQALAAQFNRNICFLMPTHPDMTDDSLRSAINCIPDNCIVVFEDIDSLFAPDRSKLASKSSLTFSGLLNALDGISSPNGQIFVLTTNLRDKLDSALIRNGRVDLHIEFTYAVPEQMEMMWRNFYPAAENLAIQFGSSVTALLREHDLQVTTAGLQHFFVMHMDSSPECALEDIQSIVSEIKQNSSKQMIAEASTASTDSSTTEKQALKKRSNRNNRRRKSKTPVTSAEKKADPSSSSLTSEHD